MEDAGASADIAVVQAWVPHYREPFFELLRAALAARGVRFHLFHGQPYREDAAKGGAVGVPWAQVAPNRVLQVGGRQISWQQCWDQLRGMDLIVLEQSTAQLLLYPLWARHLLGGPPLALWGHGRNFQRGRASSTGEAVKRLVSRHVHWWFAYNEHSAAVVRDLGYPTSRITDVRNAVDTTALRSAARTVGPAQLDELRRDLALPRHHVGVYVGSMYREKRIPYLLEACLKLRGLLPDFHMLFLGDGPDEGMVSSAADQHPWIHMVGSRFGVDRVPYYLLADLHLMPGLVGLAVLDSFALGVPLVTLADSEHSPEIAYLVDGENGRILPPGTSPAHYGREVAALLADRQRVEVLRAGCAESALRFSVEAMAERFSDGVLSALAAPRRLGSSTRRRPAPGGAHKGLG